MEIKLNPLYDFFIKIKPKPKDRPRTGRNGFYTPSKTLNYEKAIREEAKLKHSVEKVSKPIRLYMYFFFYKKMKNGMSIKDTRPDVDNLAKAVMDGLNGVLYDDDGLVFSVIGEKYNVNNQDEEGVRVVVYA